MSQFYLSIKSTIDKVATDLAHNLGIGFVELDDTSMVDSMLGSPDSLIVYQMVGLQPDPIDPLYRLSFAVGAKTTSDPANYDLATLIAAITDVIAEGEQFDVMNYSGASQPTVKEGFFLISNAQVDPQMFDGLAGIRMLSVQAQAQRFPDSGS